MQLQNHTPSAVSLLAPATGRGAEPQRFQFMPAGIVGCIVDVPDEALKRIRETANPAALYMLEHELLPVGARPGLAKAVGEAVLDEASDARRKAKG